MVTGVALIDEERGRQVEEFGYSAEHDDEHDAGQLALAAACYAIPVDERAQFGLRGDGTPALWPWERAAWRPKAPVQDLVRAGALIAAEIDRRLRLGELP